MNLATRSDDDGKLARLLEIDMTRPWALLLKQLGVAEATGRMSEFYGNVAILSGLLAIFAATEFIDPPVSSTDGMMASIVAMVGAISFSLFLGSVIECILMSNTVKKMSSDSAFITFLLGEQTSLALATYGFMGGCLFLTIQLAAITWITHTPTVAINATAMWGLLFVGLFMRFVRLSAYQTA